MQKQHKYTRSNKQPKNQKSQYTKLHKAHEERGFSETETIREYYAFLSNGRVLDCVARFRKEAVDYFNQEAKLHGLTVESVHYYN